LGSKLLHSDAEPSRKLVPAAEDGGSRLGRSYNSSPISFLAGFSLNPSPSWFMDHDNVDEINHSRTFKEEEQETH
jgi:hypothetical protein